MHTQTIHKMHNIYRQKSNTTGATSEAETDYPTTRTTWVHSWLLATKQMYVYTTNTQNA